jgi:hypothetical protein
MKRINLLASLILMALMLGSSTTFGQSKDFSEIHFYRLKQSMMSGATGMEVKIIMNDKEMGSFSNGTKLTCKVYSEGPIKIKCVGMMAGGIVGSPFVTTLDVKHGEEYHYGIQAYSMTGVKGEVLTEKQKEKMGKEKWADESTKEEDKANPIIKK